MKEANDYAKDCWVIAFVYFLNFVFLLLTDRLLDLCVKV